MAFNLKNDLNIYTSQNYENRERCKAYIETHTEKNIYGEKFCKFDAKIKLYILNRTIVCAHVELGSLVTLDRNDLIPFYLNQASEAGTLNLDLESTAVRAQLLHRLEEHGINASSSAYVLAEIPTKVYIKLSNGLLVSKLDNVPALEIQIDKLLLAEDSAMFRALLLLGAQLPNQLPDVIHALYGIQVKKRDLKNGHDRIQFLRNLPKTTFGITSCEKMRALISSLSGLLWMDKPGISKDAIEELFCRSSFK